MKEEKGEDLAVQQRVRPSPLSKMCIDGSSALPTSYKTCPRCGLTLASVVTVCGRCGNHFTVEGAPLAPPPPLPPLPEVRVPYQQPVPPVAPLERRQKLVAISLALGLGGIGAHGFYLGNKTMGSALAIMFVGGAGMALFFYVLSLMEVASVWLTAIGLIPLLIAGTVPLIQAARYGIANPEQFHQWYVVEKRWF